MGRQLDESLIDEICQAIRMGNYVKTACQLVGIPYNTYYRWMSAAKQAGNKPIYYKFATEVAKAEAEIEAKVVKCWVDQTPHEWQACRDFLARRFNKNWGNKDKVEHTGANGGPMQTINMAANIDLSQLTDEELNMLEKINRKLTPSDIGPDPGGEGEEIPE